MTERDQEASLWEESHNFAERLNDLMSGVLPGDLPLFKAEEARRNVLVSASPFPLYRSGQADTFAFLDVSLHCLWSSQKPILAVTKSVFKLRGPSGGPPVLHLDYQREMRSRHRPVAHYNVSSQHPILRELADPEGEARGKDQQAEVTRRIHLPVGGHRFRPALEDILMMLITDLSIMAQPDWEDNLRVSRGLFREMQTAAAVRDHPQEAIEELQRLGYNIAWPGNQEHAPHRSIREDKFYRY